MDGHDNVTVRHEGMRLGEPGPSGPHIMDMTGAGARWG